MSKLSNVFKSKVDDEVAAFTILGAMLLTFILTICFWEYKLDEKIMQAEENLPNTKLAVYEDNK